MKFCKSCILPDTRPNLIIDDDGICNACNFHKLKKKINWVERKTRLSKLVKDIKHNNKNGYDCIIPVSGGKDSTWQVVECLKLGLKPLAVTWKTPARTNIGQRNLDNLIKLGVDHIDYQINPKIEAKFMLKAFKKYGSTAIPMHMAIFNIPLKFALQFNIPLIVYGENSAQEYGGDKKLSESYFINEEWLRNYGLTNETSPKDWISSHLSKKDLTAYNGPNWANLKKQNVKAIFLGYFMKWDVENSFKIAKKVGFKIRKVGPKIGFYNYSDIDCSFISIHHWLKWYKFGFTRDMDNLSLEIRNKRISRTSALNILRKKGIKSPTYDIKLFCKFVGISTIEFNKICEKFRNKRIWEKVNNNWVIKNFILDEYFFKK